MRKWEKLLEVLLFVSTDFILCLKFNLKLQSYTQSKVFFLGVNLHVPTVYVKIQKNEMSARHSKWCCLPLCLSACGMGEKCTIIILQQHCFHLCAHVLGFVLPLFSEIPSPKVLQTPPPSPAEYRDQLGKDYHLIFMGIWCSMEICNIFYLRVKTVFS